MLRKSSSGHESPLWPALGLIGLCCVLLLPRLLSPHFGLLDDPRTLVTTRQILQGIWPVSFDVDAGRFRPLYWFYLSLLYGLAGEHPLGWFLANLALLVIICLLLWQWIAQRSGNGRLGLLAAVFFALSGPVVENFYTLSKGEPLQLLFTLGALVILAHPSERRGGRSWLLASAFFWLANAVKETALIMIPITAGWALLSWLRERRFKVTPELHSALAALLAGVGFFFARAASLSVSLTGGTYTNAYAITVSTIQASLIRWAGWLMRDFLYLLPVALFLAYRLITQKPFAHTPLALDALVWMAGWMIVFLPWAYTVEYYMLPFAAGAAWLAAIGVEAMLETLSSTWNGKRWAGISLCVALLLLLSTLPNNLTNARIQLAVDEANAHTLRTLAETLPKGARLWINIQDPNEYYEQLHTYLVDLYGRTDLQIAPFQSSRVGEVPFYVALPFIENQPRLSVRLGVYEPTQRLWNQSLVSVLQAPTTQSVVHQERAFHLLNLNVPRLLCFALPSLNYCTYPEPLLDMRRFAYGWDVYFVPADHR